MWANVSYVHATVFPLSKCTNSSSCCCKVKFRIEAGIVELDVVEGISLVQTHIREKPNPAPFQIELTQDFLAKLHFEKLCNFT